MSTYVVAVQLRQMDTHRTIPTWVSVEAPYEEPETACLLAAQLCTSHRLGFMPIATRIVEMEA